MAKSFLDNEYSAKVWDQYEYDEVGDFLISKLCFESYYPCKHFIITKSTKEKRLLCGPNILKLLQDNNLFVPSHFIHYENYNNPKQNKTNTILPSCRCSFVNYFFGCAPRERIYRPYRSSKAPGEKIPPFKI